ncbi:HlyD family efflux transporter periplasmic adaptor subunit [[Phormidium] sp. ETS-05]|uniref:HlyD family efflux transporter periplasmic adaptor subunit n=1 Tax=[Phormidium] sp. ETS-05 TaxID=222819 RepID=UPI0018EF15E5|nr:HlyD family efflux transporter periplasmic adaptor subunit [[Phormidium] sp. ETS-05]
MPENSKSGILPVVQSNEFLPPISVWTTAGGVFLTVTVGTAFAVAAVTQYSVTVKAVATFRPTGELRIVQAAVAGTVERIEVKENQEVKKGQALARLDDGRQQTQKSQLQGNIEQLGLQLIQIDAQVKSLDSQIAAETDGMNRAVGGAQAEVRRMERDYQDRKITAAAEVREAEANWKQAREGLEKARAELKSAEAQLQSVAASLKVAKSKRDRYEPLVEAGALAREQFEEAQLGVEQLEQTLESQKAILQAQIQEIQRQESGVEAARARVEGVSSALNPSDAAVAAARENIAREQAMGEAAIARLNQERLFLIQQRVEIDNQLSRNRQELQQIDRDQSQSIIRAPADGIILQLNLRNPGQVVQAGSAIASIAPRGAPLEVKARVEARDIGKVAVGQTVSLRVSACPYPDYGTLKGVVSAISPDALAAVPPSLVSATTAVYEVTVVPETLSLNSGDRLCAMQAGMEARADIITSRETLLSFILRKARLIADL